MYSQSTTSILANSNSKANSNLTSTSNISQKHLKLKSAKARLKKFQNDKGKSPINKSENTEDTLNSNSNSHHNNLEIMSIGSSTSSVLGKNKDLIYDQNLIETVNSENQINNNINNINNEIHNSSNSVSRNNSPNSNLIEKLKKVETTNIHYQNQIQLQMQSIHHLVAEKNELTTTISKLNNQVKISENTNQTSIKLNNKLDQLQREHILTKQAKTKYQTSTEQLENELEKLNESYKKVLKKDEELYEQNSELSHQLTIKSNELNNVKRDFGDLENEKINLERQIKNLNILVDQNRIGIENNGRVKNENFLNNDSINMQIKQLNVEKKQKINQITELNKSVDLYKKTVTGLTNERNNLLSQIKQVHQTWQNRLEAKEKDFKNKNLEQNKNDSDENKNLKLELENKILEMNQMNEELNNLSTRTSSLEKQNLKLTNRLNDEISNNETLTKLTFTQSNDLTELENNVRILQDQVKDRKSLISTADSERSTLQRAIQQNKDLKIQLSELQNALIVANNTKAEVMMKLESVNCKYDQINMLYNETLANLDKIKNENKNENSSKIINSSQINAQEMLENKRLNKENLQLAQILADERMSSAELNEQIDNLQNNLRIYANKVTELENQVNRPVNNSFVQSRSSSRMSVNEVNSATSHDNMNLENSLNSENFTKNDENQTSEDVLIKNLARERLKSASFNEQVLEMQKMLNSHQLNQQNEDDKYNNALMIIEQLNNRLKSELASRVLLTEKYDELELQNTQLEAQAETINDYISLYRQERNALKQQQYIDDQTRTKAEYEKNEMKEKLEQLELLVKQLLADRTMTTENAPEMTDSEMVTAEKIFNVIENVVETAGVEVEPLQLSIPYYGPQWDI